jgi:3-hydroxyisobutyrate dehydrogenase
MAAESTVGFVGLGNMGAPMASNLLKAGHKVIAFDVNEAATRTLADKGAVAAESPAAVASAARTVVTMLPSNPHVRSVYLGDSGVLAGAAPGSLLVDCSTCEPSVSKEVALAASEKGSTYMDAPVSGGTPGAEAATLTFMVGGPEEHFPNVEALLGHMGKKVVHCGGVGMGQAAKLCNNLVLGISMAAVCEGHALADRLGLDQKKLADILNTSSGRCWSSDTYNPCPGVMEGVPSSRRYTGGFACDLMIKDLGLANAAALSVQPRLGLPMAGLALQLYSLMSVHGAGRKDFSGLYEFIAESEKASSGGK